MATAKEVFDTARAVYLNDSNAQLYTDSVLLPHLREAHRDLQLTLWTNGLPVLREKSAIIPVNAGVTELTLPSDLLEPIWLKERAQGSTESWIPLAETDFEPDVRPDTTLNYWAWREDKIIFVGATSNREIQLRYHKGLALPSNENSPLGMIFCEAFLAPQTAQYAARSLGSTGLADDCYKAAELKLDLVVRANIKGQQNLPARRIPYRRFRRSRMIL